MGGYILDLVFLLSHVPNPRIYKRMKIAKDIFDIHAIYWKRSFKSFKTFFEDEKINKYEVIDSNKEYNLSLFERLSFIFKFMIKSIKLLKKIKPSIIHCEHLDMLFISYVYKFLFNKKVSIVYEVADLHNLIYNDSKKIKRILTKKIFVNIEDFLTKKVDKMIITSPYFYDFYYKKFKHKLEYFYIPNAPEKSIFKDVKFSTENNEITIGFIGAVRYFEQLKMLVDVAGKYKNIHVFIAGSGSSYNKINEYCSDLNFVDIYGPYDYETEVVNLYSRVDMIYSVYDSKSKNVRVALPNRLYEAIVSEKPIIASSNTKLGEFIEEKKIGFTVDDQSPKDLDQLLKKLSNGIISLSRYKNNCKSIKDEYYMDFYKDKIKDLYLKLSS
jgi:glycosyltransferase involved in cell wall biosynthesis